MEHGTFDGRLRLFHELDLPSQQDCTVAQCWTARSDGYDYRDGLGMDGAIRSAQVRTLANGNTVLRAKAVGLWLTPPALPPRREPDLIAQFHSTAGTCWESSFANPSRDTESQFCAASD